MSSYAPDADAAPAAAAGGIEVHSTIAKVEEEKEAYC